MAHDLTSADDRGGGSSGELSFIWTFETRVVAFTPKESLAQEMMEKNPISNAFCLFISQHFLASVKENSQNYVSFLLLVKKSRSKIRKVSGPPHFVFLAEKNRQVQSKESWVWYAYTGSKTC